MLNVKFLMTKVRFPKFVFVCLVKLRLTHGLLYLFCLYKHYVLFKFKSKYNLSNIFIVRQKKSKHINYVNYRTYEELYKQLV